MKIKIKIQKMLENANKIWRIGKALYVLCYSYLIVALQSSLILILLEEFISFISPVYWILSWFDWFLTTLATFEIFHNPFLVTREAKWDISMNSFTHLNRIKVNENVNMIRDKCLMVNMKDAAWAIIGDSNISLLTWSVWRSG